MKKKYCFISTPFCCKHLAVKNFSLSCLQQKQVAAKNNFISRIALSSSIGSYFYENQNRAKVYNKNRWEDKKYSNFHTCGFQGWGSVILQWPYLEKGERKWLGRKEILFLGGRKNWIVLCRKFCAFVFNQNEMWNQCKVEREKNINLS